MVEKRKRANTAQELLQRANQAAKRRREAAAAAEAERIMKERGQQLLKNRANKQDVERMVQRIMKRLKAQNTAGMTREEMRIAQRKRLEANEKRARNKRLANAETNANRRAMMRQLNTRGTMGGAGVRKQIAEEKYKRVLEKVMRQATYTPTDFKQLGKIVKARRDGKWSDVERLIKEWETSVKRRVCRLKKKNMQNMAGALDVPTNRKKKAELCKNIKNAI